MPNFSLILVLASYQTGGDTGTASSASAVSPHTTTTAPTTTSSTTPVNVYLYAGDQIIENVTMGHFYYQDSLGNTSHVSDAAGNLLERYTYSAFGIPTFYNAGNPNGASVSALGIKHLFQGQLRTQETGLNDYRNRVELPTMGVFLQPDPIGFKGDAANIYRFCNNNAVNRIDPMGLYNEDIPNLEEAIHVARSQVLNEVRNPNRPTKTYHFEQGGTATGRTETYTPGISVPVLRAKSGNYEIGKMVYGSVQKIDGIYYDVEPASEKGTVLPVHTHKDTGNGLGSSGWSKLDRKLKMVERMDESKPGWWHRGTRQKNGDFVEGKPQYDNGSQRTSGLNGGAPDSSSGSQSSGPTAAQVDAAHQATGVPSQAAEAVNHVRAYNL